MIAKRLKPFTDGEFVKECILTVVDIVCPDKKHLFENISLSARTVTRRVEELAENVKSSLRERVSEFVFYSLAFDESTDAKDTAQLAVFVRGVNSQFHVTEEFASLVAMKDKTTGADVLRAVKSVMDYIGLRYEQMCGVTTDGCPSMVGRVNGVVALLEKERLAAGTTAKLFKTHCIIHQEALCAKSLKMQNVMSVVVKTVNLVRKQGLNHRQFQHLLLEMNSRSRRDVTIT